MTIARGWLTAQLWCARIGFARAIAALLCVVAVALGSVCLPHLRSQAVADHDALSLAQNQLLLPVSSPPSAGTSDRDHLADFYDALGEKRHAEQQLKTLFDLAQKNGLRLNTADYKTASDKNSRLHTRQVTLPVKAAYPAVRKFAEQVLLAIPFASLDELRFKRDAIGSPLLEARLRFSLYLLDAPLVPASLQEQGQ